MKELSSCKPLRKLPRPLAALGLLLAFAGAAHAQSSVTFGPATFFSSGGSGASGIAVADVNGDGSPDLLTTNSSSSTVGVLLGNGNGSFQAGTAYSTGPTVNNFANNPQTLAVADLNDDGKPDVVAANFSSLSTGVLLGNGDGTFRAPTAYSSFGITPRGPAIGDVTGDGKPDLLFASSGSSLLAVLRGNGDGTFQGGTTYSSGGVGPFSPVIADVNGDGNPDLLAVNLNSGTVAVVLGQGNGSFQGVATYPTGISSPSALAAADVTGDGALDLLVANGAGSVVALAGNGNGTFQAATTYAAGSTAGYGYVDIKLADLNGDGRIDVLVSNLNSGTVAVLLGNGGGTFQPAMSYPTNASLRASFAVADVNGDGKPDLLTTGFGNTVGVLLNTTVYAPTLTSLSPTSGLVGTQVTLTGTNLMGATAVRFNGTAATFTVVDATTITATVPAGATTGNVTVTTPGGTSGGAAFKVQTAAPVINLRGGGTLTNGSPILDITAPAYSAITYFFNAVGGGQPLSSGQAFASANGSLTLMFGSLASASGTYVLQASAQSNGQSASPLVTFTLTVDATPPTATISTTASSPTAASPLPFAVSFSEPVTGLSASSFAVTNGTVTSGSLMGSGSGPYSFSVTPTGNGPVSVRLPANAVSDAAGNANLASNSVSVQYSPAPTLTSLSPATGPVGTSVTITGTNLTGATAVRFNGTPASSFVVNSATSLTAVVAPGTSTGLVTITTPGGTATSATPFVVRVAPTTVADTYSTPVGVTLTGNVLTNDLGTAPIAILIIRPTNGTLLLNPDGTFTYRPNPGFSGQDSFIYYACDPNLPLLCGNPATVTINVVRIAPVTVPDAYTTPQNTTLRGNVLTNDLGTNPQAILIIRPTHGTLLLNPDGTFTYQPATGFVGTDSFIYYACNQGAPLVCGDPATVTINVVRVAPITVADSYTTPQNTMLMGNVLTNDIGTNPQAILIIRPTRGTLLLNPNGTFTYQPNPGFTGTDSFIYYACNQGAPLVCGDPATVTITVRPANTATRSANPNAAKPGANTTLAGAAQELALTGSPNPFSQELRVQFALPTAQAYTLAVYDAQGRLVQQLAHGQAEAGQAQELVVSTQTYATGLYLLRLTTPSGTQLLKLIKQ